MKKCLMFLCAVMLVLGVAMGAQANGFYEEFTSNVWLNSNNPTHTWTFNLDTDSLYEGWNLGTSSPYGTADINPEDTINAAFFSLGFYDDELLEFWPFNQQREYGDLTVDGNQWFSEEIDLLDSVVLANVTGLLTDHLLTVTVDRVGGDFGVAFTSLVGCYTDNPSQVPEPASMLLLGFGLLGLAGAGRKLKSC